MATGRWRENSENGNGEGLKGPTLRSTRAKEEETAMSKSFKALGLAVGALALTHLPATAQTKVTNEGISANEIVIGTHQDLSGPIKVWGVPVSNGMKMAVEEINAAGGINGRKLRMILEDNGYDPKKGAPGSWQRIGGGSPPRGRSSQPPRPRVMHEVLLARAAVKRSQGRLRAKY